MEQEPAHHQDLSQKLIQKRITTKQETNPAKMIIAKAHNPDQEKKAAWKKLNMARAHNTDKAARDHNMDKAVKLAVKVLSMDKAVK